MANYYKLGPVSRLYKDASLVEYPLPAGEDFSSLRPRLEADQAFFRQLCSDDLLRNVYFHMSKEISGVHSLEDNERAIRTVLDAVINRAHFAIDQKEFLRQHFNGLDERRKYLMKSAVNQELRQTCHILRPLSQYDGMDSYCDKVLKCMKEKLEPHCCGPPIVGCTDKELSKRKVGGCSGTLQIPSRGESVVIKEDLSSNE